MNRDLQKVIALEKSNKTKKKTICVECGKEYTCLTSSARYCSERCRGIFRSRSRNVKYVGDVSSLDNEIWKDIRDFEGMYQISNLGRIKGLYRMDTQKNGWVQYYPEKILKPNISTTGYYTLSLTRHDIKTRVWIHRLVAIHFIENPENKREVNHIDGNKLNNLLSNLEWATHKENMQHAVRVGLLVNPKGENASKAKLKDADIIEIRRRYDAGEKPIIIAKDYPVQNHTISSIGLRRTWKHI